MPLFKKIRSVWRRNLSSGLMVLIGILISTISPAQKRAAYAVPSYAKKLFKQNFHTVPDKAMDAYPSAFGITPLNRDAVADSVAIFKGIMRLKAGRPSEALPLLKEVAGRYSSVVSNVSEWYLALCYLALGEVDHAEYYFHKIADTEVHPYQNEAEIVFQTLLGHKR